MSSIKYILERLAVAQADAKAMEKAVQEAFFPKEVKEALYLHMDKAHWNDLTCWLSKDNPNEVCVRLLFYDAEGDYSADVIIPVAEFDNQTVPQYLTEYRRKKLEEHKAAEKARQDAIKIEYEAKREKREKQQLARLLKKYPRGK
jgi:predicted GIY-YIG superfamily endonuclease